MNSNAPKTNQLDALLQTLTPEAARVLIREVERDRLLGHQNFPHEFVLDHARAVIGVEDQKSERTGSPRRYFCEAFADRLVDEVAPHKQTGRILRSSIEPVWEWINGPMAGDVIEPLVIELTEAILDKNKPETSRLADELCVVAGREIMSAVNALVPNTRTYLRTAAKLGGTRVLEDAIDIAGALAYSAVGVKMRARLPEHIAAIGLGDTEPFVALLRTLCAGSPEAATTGLLAIMARLTVKTDILKIIVDYAGSRRDSKLANSKAAITCECLLHDMAVSADHAVRLIEKNAPVQRIVAQVARFYTMAEAFEHAIDLDLKGKWGSRLVDVRKRLSLAISRKIASTPRVLKSALFRRAGAPAARHGEIGATPLVWPDEHDIKEARFQAGLLHGIRPYLGQLPINAEVTRITAEVNQFLESLGEIVVNDLLSSSGETRACAESYLEATSGLFEIVFGKEEGDLLRRRGRAAARTDELAS